MRAKNVIALFFVIVICSSFISAIAHGDYDHSKEMESVLLGNNAAMIMGDAPRKKLIRYLEYATSIALDQFNGFKGTLLLYLHMYGVPELPKNTTDTWNFGGINFTASGQTHRQYTHLGWTYVYNGPYLVANWPLRKKIMVNTVKKVLDSTDDELCDNFAAILYYIHILGDIQDDSSRTERDQVIPLIEKHGMSDLLHYQPNKDIFIELSHYLVELLKNKVPKTYRSYYNRMIRNIRKLHYKARHAMKQNDTDTIEENDNNLTQEQLDDYSIQLLQILSLNLPILLQHSIFDGILYY